ncbi:MAG: hypothetical protein AVDCRST_MAG18-3927 [uncultured Thermomicrobiales bacterium]|uniref:Uncharacterized protein n=1 Tax=uncultured Thermomicrobiales bacterium TaxID=1645740 RepID=A0A6J4VXR2_9BACT|nr:MAG: hypothetical protein AVDCRST_MAG18-3927 [uncultured Thermomicrobiales bacterium]
MTNLVNGGNCNMYAYEPILRDLERRVRASYARQVLDPARPDRGAFLGERDGYANPDHTANAKDLASACYCFLAEESALIGDDELFERIGLALALQRRWQRSTGLIDLVSINWESPPDTGFTVQLLAPVIGLARERAADGDERAGEIAAGLGEYVRTAARGMIGRGFHTPNHRWVVCSGLAQALTLFPELPAREYVDSILAEGIDINADGEYTERSTGVYNAVCNRSLRFMADGLGKPELLDHVRRNLELMAHLFHHDGTVVTSISNRQDRGQRVVPLSIADSFYDLARRDGNGTWASIADQLVAEGSDFAHQVWLIHPFLASPGYRDDTLARQPLPDNYRKVFPASGLWRVRRGPLSATAATANLTVFAVRYGEVALKAVKIASTYSHSGKFSAEMIEEAEGGVRLTHQAAAKHIPGYDLPLGRPVPFGEFARLRPERERWTLPPMDQILDIREVPGGFDLHLRTEGGLDRITSQIECCFAGPGEWETADQAIQVADGQTAILKSGHGVFHRGEHGISVGPGGDAHRMWQMRGTEPEPDSFRVLITLQTPIDRVLEIRYGRWSPASGGLLPG